MDLIRVKRGGGVGSSRSSSGEGEVERSLLYRRRWILTTPVLERKMARVIHRDGPAATQIAHRCCDMVWRERQ